MVLVIVNMCLNEKIDFGNIVPDDISDSNSNMFEAITIDGRSSPLAFYSGSGPRNLSFNLTLHEDDLPLNRVSMGKMDINTTLNNNATDTQIKDFDGGLVGSSKISPIKITLPDFIAKVQALTYPEYLSSGAIKSPMCYIRIGNHIKLKGYCENVSVDWKTPVRGNHNICADVSLSFTEVLSIAFSASEIRDGIYKTGGRYGKYFGQYGSGD